MPVDPQVEISVVVGRCIYCATTEPPLRDEHVMPYGLLPRGEPGRVLRSATCPTHATLTSAFETAVLGRLLRAARVGLDLRSRRPRVRELPLAIGRGQDIGHIILPISSFPAMAILPQFAAPPAHLDGRPYGGGIEVRGARVCQVSGPPIGAVAKQLNQQFGVNRLDVIGMLDVHRMGQIIPINWQSGQIASNHLPDPIAAGVIGYHTADAQNVIAWHAVKNNFEWLLLWEDDVLPPFDAMICLDRYTHSKEYPVVSGLYFSKGVPSWPLIFRGRGNGAYLNFKIGDKVWCDGIPTGFLLVHMSVIRWLWDNSPEVQMPDGTSVRQVFKFPRDAWFDPEQDRYFSRMGTSDLYFCFRVMKERIFEKCGWSKHAKKHGKWPFLVDTKIFCRR